MELKVHIRPRPEQIAANTGIGHRLRSLAGSCASGDGFLGSLRSQMPRLMGVRPVILGQILAEFGLRYRMGAQIWA